MNRVNLLPENQIADLIQSISNDVRDIKLLQQANTSGLIFYESQSGQDWDFNQTVPTVGGGQSAPGVPLTITATVDPNTLLLADFIVEAATINGTDVSRVFADPASPTQKNVNKWRVFLVSNTQGNVLAQFKCRIVANTDITITVEYNT